MTGVQDKCLVCGFVGRPEEHRSRHIPKWASDQSPSTPTVQEVIDMRDHMRRVVRAALPCLTDAARTDRRALHDIAHAVGMHQPKWHSVAHDVIRDMIDRGELIGVKP